MTEALSATIVAWLRSETCAGRLEWMGVGENGWMVKLPEDQEVSLYKVGGCLSLSVGDVVVAHGSEWHDRLLGLEDNIKEACGGAISAARAERLRGICEGFGLKEDG
jgi:hypothetical protein